MQQEQKLISEVDNVANGINELINNTDNIDDLLSIWTESNKGVKRFEEINDRIKAKLKAYLKERNWDSYISKKSKVSIKLSMIKREDIDRQQLKLLLSDSQYSLILKTSTYEKLDIITPERRNFLKKLVK